jgi:drug/metabolite transporter (DMT)-like permease
MSSHVRPATHLKKGILWMLVASLFNASTSALAKYALGFTTVEMTVFARSCVGFLLILPYISLIKDGRPFHQRWNSQDKKMHLLRGVSALASLYLAFYSLKTLDLADSMVLTNTMPIFIPFVLFLWKGVPIQHRLWWGVGLSFLGVLLIIHPGLGVFQGASLIALLSGVTAAIATTALRYAHFKESSTLTLFYYFLITFAISGAITLFSFQSNWSHMTPPLIGWLSAVGLSGFGWQISFTLATKHAPIRVTTPLLYIAVIFSIFIDWWVWNRGVTFWETVGFACTIAGACLVVFLFPKSKN